MTRYKDALEEVASETVDRHADGYYQPKTVEHFHSGAIDTLRELVEKATPQQTSGRMASMKLKTLLDVLDFDTILNIYDQQGFYEGGLRKSQVPNFLWNRKVVEVQVGNWFVQPALNVKINYRKEKKKQ